MLPPLLLLPPLLPLLLLLPPLLLLLLLFCCVAATGVATATVARVGVGVGVGCSLLGSQFGLQPGECRIGATLLFLFDQPAEPGLSAVTALDVFGGQRFGLLLFVGDRDREHLGLGPLRLELLALVVEITDQLVEVIGGTGADAEGDPAVLIAAETLAVLVGVREQRPQDVGTVAGEGPNRHFGEITTERVEFGLFVGDPLFGGDDLDVELILGVDRLGVVLGEDVGLGVQTIELVDDPLDFASLVLDGCLGDLGEDRRGDHRECRSNDDQTAESGD